MEVAGGNDNFEGFATGLPQLVFGCLATGERTWPSPQWIIFTGLSAADSAGFGWLEAVHPDDRQATMAAWAEAQSTGEYFVEHRMRRGSDGRYHWHQTRALPLETPLLLSSGTVDWVGGSVDVDDLYRVRQQLAGSEQKLRTLVEGVPQLLWRSTDIAEWIWASPQWRDFTGQSQQGSRGHGWLDAVHPDDREKTMGEWAAAPRLGLLNVEFRVRRGSDGAYVWHRTRAAPVSDPRSQAVEWLGATTDIQDIKELQEHQRILLTELQRKARELEEEIKQRQQIEATLLHRALHDDLTGLHNRVFLTERLRVTLEQQAKGAGSPCTLLFLDLDRFKLVNDSLGHHAGDLLLVEVARRLRGCVGSEHTLARFGGDEFAVLCEGVDDVGAAEGLAERIIAGLRQPIRLGHQEVFTSCSIGVVHTTTSHGTANEVIRDADIAMYHSKHQGGDAYALFSSTMRDSAVESLELRTDLRNAVARNELRLHYQPIYKIASGTIVGFEALLRWQHPQRGLISPVIFMATAEESGIIREIGRWVLREACGQLRVWHDQFPRLNLYMNANASAVELRQPAYASYVRDALSAAGLNPRHLQLEVTESIFLHQPGVVDEVLDSLRKLGARIALDDFGTGYSSLSYLDRYEFDSLKIDRSFVAEMISRPKAATIVAAIVALGRAMGLNVVAEGTETDAQLQALQKVGCELVQGYLLGRPQAADSIIPLLAAQQQPSPDPPV